MVARVHWCFGRQTPGRSPPANGNPTISYFIHRKLLTHFIATVMSTSKVKAQSSQAKTQLSKAGMSHRAFLIYAIDRLRLGRNTTDLRSLSS